MRLDTAVLWPLIGSVSTTPDPDSGFDPEQVDLGEARSHPRERARIESLKKMVPRDVASILDVGARDGYLSLVLADQVHRVVALDLVPVSIHHARVSTVTGDARSLCFVDGAFDLVLCAEVLEHIDGPALATVCAELVRVSRRYVLIGVPYRQDTRFGRLNCSSCGERNPPWGHVSVFDEPRLRALFPGLKTERISYAGADKNRTNALSAVLNDLAGNPWGTYGQQERCIACGTRVVAPTNRTLTSRVASRAAHYLNVIQHRLISPRPTWIHVLFVRQVEVPDQSAVR